jgi:hypothetical protein
MMWISKFVHLLYVAYLDCETTLRDVSFIVVGMVGGLIALILTVGYFPPDWTVLEVMLLTISLWNLGIAMVLAFQYIVSAVVCFSMLKVGYLYDNKSWEYVNIFNRWCEGVGRDLVKGYMVLDKQLDTDKLDKRYNLQKHDDMIIDKIQRVKER